ncbi:hypothetical protein PN499_16685 [Kamptonema animale CS-326]|jgi:hypothetical protein|uniref:hypothetical protein n=1 Tax=Kamptonema animale TaxID=92934 RepID=UPI00232E9C57|nr:hypothetical protein [Kamptonema animale]MDB9512827.1 hypothetical protein [Kamptonema animale CS-326]
MALLPDETIIIVQNLQRDILERLHAVTATEFSIQELFGEISEMLDYFEQLQNAKERLYTYYRRFYITLQQIYEAQPLASRDMLILLTRYIDEAEATAASTEATVQEIRRDINLP